MTSAAQVAKQLESWGAENVRQIYLRLGAEHAYGVPLAKVRGLASQIGTDHALGLSLWETGAHEARILACMLLDPSSLGEKAARALVVSSSYGVMADELVSRVLAEAPFAAKARDAWREAKDPLVQRVGWKLLAKSVETLDADTIDATLTRLEREMPEAPFLVKEGMNFCLVQIGTRLASSTERAVAIGERLGVWDLRPIPKGCTSAYAPEWIAVLLARKSPAWKARAAQAITVRDAALKAAKATSKAPKAAATKKAVASKAAPKKAVAKAAPKKTATRSR